MVIERNIDDAVFIPRASLNNKCNGIFLYEQIATELRDSDGFCDKPFGEKVASWYKCVTCFSTVSMVYLRFCCLG